MEQTTIGQRVRSAREETGMGQIPFSKEAGISQTKLSCIERDVHEIGIEDIKSISKRFGISFMWLAFGEGEKKSSKHTTKKTLKSLSTELDLARSLLVGYQKEVSELKRRLELIENEVKVINFKIS